LKGYNIEEVISKFFSTSTNAFRKKLEQKLSIFRKKKL
jgi:hypothetical protein